MSDNSGKILAASLADVVINMVLMVELIATRDPQVTVGPLQQQQPAQL